MPVLVNGVNKLFLSSISYISLPVQSVSTGIFSNSGQPNVPLEYKLGQNYPNPFNPSTTIQYALPARSRVKLQIFNMLGQRVIELAEFNEEVQRSDRRLPSVLSNVIFFLVYC